MSKYGIKQTYRDSLRNIYNELRDLATSREVAPEDVRQVKTAMQQGYNTGDFRDAVKLLAQIRDAKEQAMRALPRFDKIWKQIQIHQRLADMVVDLQATASHLVNIDTKTRAARYSGPWKVVMDRNTGQPYWWNPETDETTISDPRPEPSPYLPPISEYYGTQTAPPGWTQVLDKSGEYYWYNTNTGETTWDLPKTSSGSSFEDDISIEDLDSPVSDSTLFGGGGARCGGGPFSKWY